MPDDNPRPPRHRYSVGDIFMCDHAPSNGVYEAKVVGVREATDNSGGGGVYTVHYLGWGKRYDEEISFEDSELRMYNCTRAEYMAELGLAENPQNLPQKPEKTAKKRPRPVENEDFDVENGLEDSDSAPEEDSESDDSEEEEEEIEQNPRKKSKLAFETVSTDVHLTPPLLRILSDDYKAISAGFLTKIPAKFSIDRIIRDYLKTIPCKTEDLQNIDDIIIEYEETEVRITNLALICVANGVKDYFNAVCGSSSQLLYAQERTQHTELVRFKARQMGLAENSALNTIITKGFKHTAEYGIVHLVRLLSKLPQLLSEMDWEPRLLHRIMIGIHDLVVFLNKNWQHYHLGMEMYTSSAEMKKSILENGLKAEKTSIPEEF